MRRFSFLFVALALLTAACAGDAAEDDPEPDGLHFVDVAAERGLDFTHGAFRWGLSADAAAMMGGGLCWIDYDGDGWLDLFLVNTYAQEEWSRWQDEGGLPTTALYRNERGRFENVTDETGAGFEVRGSGCVAADLDGDGHTDLYVTTERESLLLWNEGGEAFREGSVPAGAGVYGWHTGAAAGDVDGDGRMDLFVAGYVDQNNRNPESASGFPGMFLGRRDLLFLNQGGEGTARPTFREVGAVAGLESDGDEYGLGALLADLDGDGDLDLFVANDTRPNRLYENVAMPGGAATDPEGLGFRFVDRSMEAGVGDDNSGMGVAAADFDGNGLTDLLVTNLGAQLHSVYAGDARPFSFTEASGRITPDFGVGRTGWGVAWADFDRDADLDLMLVNGHVPIADRIGDAQPIDLYLASPSGFQSAAAATGLTELGSLLGRGSAVADYDNDGDLDVAVLVVGGPVLLLENRGGGGHWLTVDAGGAPGTVVTVIAGGTTRRCEVRAGSSYLSTEDPRCSFGFGEAAESVDVTVTYPDGTTRSEVGARLDRILDLRQP